MTDPDGIALPGSGKPNRFDRNNTCSSIVHGPDPFRVHEFIIKLAATTTEMVDMRVQRPTIILKPPWLNDGSAASAWRVTLRRDKISCIIFFVLLRVQAGIRCQRLTSVSSRTITADHHQHGLERIVDHLKQSRQLRLFQFMLCIVEIQIISWDYSQIALGKSATPKTKRQMSSAGAN